MDLAVYDGQGIFPGLDDATAALIFEGYVEDSKRLYEESQARSKNREGVLSDYQIALKLNQEEMQRGAAVLQDRQISKSITRAVIDDAEALAASQAEDQVAFEDRRIACQLAGVPLPPRTNQAARGLPHNPVPINDRDLEVLESLYVRNPDQNPDAGIYTTGRGLVEREREPPLTCVVCQEESRFIQKAPVACGHAYCRDCIQDLFHRSFKDESLFPPKCCGDILDPSAMRLLLSAEIIINYEKRKVELEDPNRTYCVVKTCSKYIPRANIYQDRAICPTCSTQTCALCKSAWHAGDCPADRGLQQVLANANREGWQRCSACRAMIDLSMGCNHITCRCKHEFCYQCGAQWKTCECPTWQEDRLLEERLRQEPPQPEAGPAHAPAVRIIDPHCDHPRFVRRPGRHVCDTCGNAHARFGFRCLGCNMARCATCRYNR